MRSRHDRAGKPDRDENRADVRSRGAIVKHAEAERRFALARVAHLATVHPTGRPHVVPCTFALMDDRIVSVVEGKPKRTNALQRLENIRAEPRASVLVDRYDEDWLRLWWGRADGAARVVDEGPDRDSAVAALTVKYPQYRVRRPPGPAVIVDVDLWTMWEAAPPSQA